MKLQGFVVGQLQENTYILMNEAKEALIFDPGAQGLQLIHWMDHEGIKPLAILLTHGHFDHIGAVDDIRDHYDIEVYIHELDQDFLSDGWLNLSQSPEPIARPADHLWQGDRLMAQIGDFEFEVMHLPGHSPGHVVYYFADEGFVISGDTLFQGSIGRTDFPGCNHQDLIDGILQKLFSLADDTIVYPGHGQATQIGIEKATNPFL